MREGLIGLAAPANDNPPLLARRARRGRAGVAPGSATMQAALRFFAAHGLAAAQKASALAGSAAGAGDEKGADYWREISLVLDPRAGGWLVR